MATRLYMRFIWRRYCQRLAAAFVVLLEAIDNGTAKKVQCFVAGSAPRVGIAARSELALLLAVYNLSPVN